MLEFPGYVLTEKIFESPEKIFFRGFRRGDHHPVLVRTPGTPFPTIYDRANYKFEFELAARLGLDGLLKPLGLETSHNGLALITEDFGGRLLEARTFFDKYGLEGFMSVAIQLAETLGRFHRGRVIHRNIKPRNILLDEKALTARMIGFLVATPRSGDNSFDWRETRSGENLSTDLYSGNLPYFSPEQTGRIDRPVDHRSDLYSLGLTFYEMLTGSLPFASDDPVTLVHCHLARLPDPPIECDQRVPRQISDIVMKLLCKAAEDRYQSGFGLVADLRACQKDWRERGRLQGFALGARDVPHEFLLPRKVYGRDKELALLLTSLDLVRSDGRPRFLPVIGPSGIGKTTLVNEIRKVVFQKGGFFVTGCYEQANRHMPYQGIIAAFRDLIRQILALSPAAVQTVKGTLARELGKNTRLIADLAPELQLLTGDRAHPPETGAGESRNRFRMVVGKFLGAFAQPSSPLVLFLDDIHLAGKATFTLLQDLLSGGDARSLLIIGAFQGDGVNGEHVLERFNAEFGEAGLPPLSPSPLGLPHVRSLVKDVLKLEPEDANALAELVLEKTAGRPLAIGLLLQSLVDSGLLHFDVQADGWLWDRTTVETFAFPSHGIDDYLAARIDELPEPTRETLKVASCIGRRFSLSLLALARRLYPAQIVTQLQPAIEADLIAPIGDDYQLLQSFDPTEVEAAVSHPALDFQFSHTKVQETVYALMDDRQTWAIHFEVGQQLLGDGENLEGDFFQTVDQLNRGRECITTAGERLQLARLNLEAGVKAKSMVANVHAGRYFQIALSLLPEDEQERDYDLWFTLSLHQAEMIYYTHDLATADARFADLLDHARTRRDKARVFINRVLILNNISRLEDAVRVGVEGLRLYDVTLAENEKNREMEIERLQREIIAYFDQNGRRAIFDLPEDQDETYREYLLLLLYLTPVAFNTDQRLFRLITLLLIHHALKHGHSDLTSYAYSVFGILMGSLGRYEDGAMLGSLALSLNRKFPNSFLSYKLRFINCNLLQIWVKPLSETSVILDRVYRDAMLHGDLVYANYTILVKALHRWVMGESRLDLLQDLERDIRFAQNTKNAAVEASLRFLAQAILNLRGLTRSSSSMDSELFQESEHEANLAKTNYRTGLSVLNVIKMQILYLRGHIGEASIAAARGSLTIVYSQNTIMMAVHFLYDALILAACFDEADQQERRQILKSIADHERRFKKWARLCPENFAAPLLLIAAERNRIEGQDMKAMAAYRDALTAASEHGGTLEEALAHELAARFFKLRGFAPYALYHYKAAFHCYQQWGAVAKCLDLEREMNPISLFPDAFPVTDRDEDSFDLVTMMKTAQTISSEFRMEVLLKTLMRLVLENAGAQLGYLILVRRDGLVPAVRGEDDEIVLLNDAPLSAYPGLAKSVVQYVFRSKTEVLFDDGVTDQRFSRDANLASSGVRALLCLPIMRQTEMTGILYLENRLAGGVFSNKRMKLLRLLAPQIAVSLENARFISEITELNKSLRNEIEQRKKAEESLKKAQALALANAHKVGRAEFADSVLHNVKNILNSVGLSGQKLEQICEHSKLKQLDRTLVLINENRDRLDAFFTQDERGKLVPDYLNGLYQILKGEQATVTDEVRNLVEKLTLMRDLIVKQQTRAKKQLETRTVDIILAIEEALKLQEDPIKRYGVQVLRSYASEIPIKAEKSRVTHVLVNLIKNAVEAMRASERKILTVATYQDTAGRVSAEIRDSGSGITAEEIENLFTHGFTTKPDGHGFGLHYCAKAMKEMAGCIDVLSDGPGRGAAFILTFTGA